MLLLVTNDHAHYFTADSPAQKPSPMGDAQPSTLPSAPTGQPGYPPQPGYLPQPIYGQQTSTYPPPVRNVPLR